MRDIACVMITCDRSQQKNYLDLSLRSLSDSVTLCGERASPGACLTSLLVVENGDRTAFSSQSVIPVFPGAGLISQWGPANRAVAVALEEAAVAYGSWLLPEDVGRDSRFVLLLEDDIDVCADFFDSVGAWLDDHAREDRRIYSFGANYPQVQELYDQCVYAWDYPIEKFYGTQAFAIRPDDALSLAEYIREHCYDRSPDGTQWDLLMQDWSRETYPEIDHFLASCPAFVQHVGDESVVMPGRKGHTYPSWPGRGWSYLKERQR